MKRIIIGTNGAGWYTKRETAEGIEYRWAARRQDWFAGSEDGAVYLNAEAVHKFRDNGDTVTIKSAATAERTGKTWQQDRWYCERCDKLGIEQHKCQCEPQADTEDLLTDGLPPTEADSGRECAGYGLDPREV